MKDSYSAWLGEIADTNPHPMVIGFAAIILGPYFAVRWMLRKIKEGRQ